MATAWPTVGAPARVVCISDYDDATPEEQATVGYTGIIIEIDDQDKGADGPPLYHVQTVTGDAWLYGDEIAPAQE